VKRRFFQYVVFAAVVVAANFLIAGSVQAQNYASGTASISTPRTLDGKPDLSGMWNGNDAPRGGQIGGAAKCDPKDKTCFETKPGTFPTRVEENGDVNQRVASRRCDPTEKGPDGIGCYENSNQNADFEFTGRVGSNRPLYRPEYWDKVQDLDYNTNTKDPIFTCMPLGVPRMGPPVQIIQSDKYVALFYSGSGIQTNQFRIVPIDGRGHDPVRAKDISYFGDPVGRWEADTLVIESVGFTDASWIASGPYGGGGGYFHTYDMKVTERFRRDGNTLHYQAIVDDPTVLLEPWAMTARELVLNPDPKTYLQEGDQCSQPDPGWVTNKIRH
jgi:hypothetical protein